MAVGIGIPNGQQIHEMYEIIVIIWCNIQSNGEAVAKSVTL